METLEKGTIAISVQVSKTKKHQRKKLSSPALMQPSNSVMQLIAMLQHNTRAGHSSTIDKKQKNQQRVADSPIFGS